MTPEQWVKRMKAMRRKHARKMKAAMRKPLTITAWTRKYPTGTFSCLLYTDDEVKRQRCYDKCDPEPFGKLVKVRVSEIK